MPTTQPIIHSYCYAKDDSFGDSLEELSVRLIVHFFYIPFPCFVLFHLVNLHLTTENGADLF